MRTVMMDNPVVSIITPTLNGIEYLETCIQSVLNQGYPYTEHVFVDGGSTDGTVEALLAYQSRYPARIRFVSEPGRNAREAWNKGWEMAKGDIFGFLGTDDFLEPGAIPAVVEFFKSNPAVCFVFGGSNFVDDTGEIIGRWGTKDFNLKEAINYVCDIPAMSAYYRRELIQKIGLMDTTVNACDLDYWIRVGKELPIYRIGRVLSNYRLHKDSVSHSRGGQVYPRECFIISRRHGGSFFSMYAIRYYAHLAYRSSWPVLYLFRPIIRPVKNRVIFPLAQRVVRTILRI